MGNPDVLQVFVLPYREFDQSRQPIGRVVVSQCIDIIRTVDDTETTIQAIKILVDDMLGASFQTGTISPNIVFVTFDPRHLKNAMVPATKIVALIDELKAEDTDDTLS